MDWTCCRCHGDSAGYDEANLRCCSGCQKVFYCSTECQKDDWFRYLFDCNLNRRINTADYLALAVHENRLPLDPQTCQDYGFYHALTPDAKSRLLGLYTGLIKDIGVSPQTIHRWLVSEGLILGIKGAYSKLPESSRGDSFWWFLRNENVIGRPSPETMRSFAAAMAGDGWRFTGGDASYSIQEINAAIARKPQHEQECHWLYMILLSKATLPFPDSDHYLMFGFVTCNSRAEVMQLGASYRKLIHKCTFREFCSAYSSGGLLTLFRSKEVLTPTHIKYLLEIIANPRECYKSVWWLKQTVEDDSTDAFQRMHPAVRADYGFFACKDDLERLELKRVYKAFFETHKGDPVALHNAAIQGNIHGFLSRIVGGLQDPKYRRMMWNPYPLPEE